MKLEKELPKVLIIGESFHTTSGGGITLSTLFSNWTKERTAVVASYNTVKKSDVDKSSSYYVLGFDCLKMIFPFSIFQNKIKSGPYKFRNSKEQAKSKPTKKAHLMNLIIKQMYSVLHFFGLYQVVERSKVINEMNTWINEFNPDFIYSQLSSRAIISLVKEVTLLTSKPLVVHIMDDWPTSINKFGLLKRYWDKKIDKEFKDLLLLSNKRLAISSAMANEYNRRYKGKWEYFHNPVDIKFWSNYPKKDYVIKSKMKILYLGRVGVANIQSVKLMVSVIDKMVKKGIGVEFHLYGNIESSLIGGNTIGSFIHESIAHIDVPKLIQEYDLLYLPLDRDKISLKFSKLSMPTKTSEFMISGVPILLNVSPISALYEFFNKNNAAIILEEDVENKLIYLIESIISNESIRRNHGVRANKIATRDFNSDIVLKDFEKIFI